MCDCKDLRPKAVWSNKAHPDYFRYVLRNGSIDPNTFESVDNFADNTFLENKKAFAGSVIQHKHKEVGREPFRFRPDGSIEVDTTDRDDVYDYRNARQSTADTMFVDLLRTFPEVKDEEEIKKKLREIEAGVPQNIPNRSAVIDTLIRDYMMTKFRQRFIGNPAQGLQDSVDALAPQVETIRQRLERLTRLQVAEEGDALGSMDVAVQARRRAEQERDAEEADATRRALAFDSSSEASRTPPATSSAQMRRYNELVAELQVRGIPYNPRPDTSIANRITAMTQRLASMSSSKKPKGKRKLKVRA